MAHDLYISHSTKDKPIADAACVALEAGGISCWIAPRDVPPGAVWSEAILDAISKSRGIVLVLSPRANDSEHVKREIERAVSMGVPVIPFRVEDVQPSGALGYFLMSYNWIDAISPPLDSHLPKLVDAAHKLLGSKPVGISSERKSAVRVSDDHYDVFISYRRENGAAEARLIRAELREKSIRSFLDVDDLKSGHFDAALLRRIEEAPNFIVILSPNSLDRCIDKRDWLRQEIAQAVATDRNIIPIMLRGFTFPDAQKLPDDIKALPMHNGLEYSHKYFNAMIADILSYLSNVEKSGIRQREQRTDPIPRRESHRNLTGEETDYSQQQEWWRAPLFAKVLKPILLGGFGALLGGFVAASGFQIAHYGLRGNEWIIAPIVFGIVGAILAGVSSFLSGKPEVNRVKVGLEAIKGLAVGAVGGGLSSLVGSGGYRNEALGVVVSAINGATVGLLIAWTVSSSSSDAIRAAIFGAAAGSGPGGC